LELEIEWQPLAFGNFGAVGGISRLIRLYRASAGYELIHARGDFAALVALFRGPEKWIWDCRALSADQRLALSSSFISKLTYLPMRLIEYLIAHGSSKIVVITEAVIPILKGRYKLSSEKFQVIPTCVDLDTFIIQDLPPTDELRILLSGTFSNAYDLEITNSIIKSFRNLHETKVTVAIARGATQNWKKIDYDEMLTCEFFEMPDIIARHHLGLSLIKENLGVSLKSIATTKSAEFLAVGRPIVVNSNQGDLGQIVTIEKVGFAVSQNGHNTFDVLANEILKLLTSENIENRCHAVASKYFSLDKGVAGLLSTYLELENT
jgi:glycosyltransferase involved in cell wall biosynthesis